MKSLAIALVFLLAACGASDGTRCNPLQFSSTPGQGDCNDGESCVYPTGPNCGVAYCCKTDATGAIVDKSPRCQPDPTAAQICMLDLALPVDGGADDLAR